MQRVVQVGVESVASTQGTGRPNPSEARDLARMALSLAIRACRNREDAAEVAQDALLKLLLCWPEVRNPVSWLRTVVRHLATAAARCRRGAEQSAGLLGAISHDPGVDPQRAVELADLLRRLSGRDRELLELTILGFTQAEIAEQLGCSAKGVGLLIGRARARALRLHAKRQDRV